MTAKLYWSKTSNKTYYYIIIPISAKEFRDYWNLGEEERDYCRNLVIFKFNLGNNHFPPHIEKKIKRKRKRSRLFGKSPLKFTQQVNIFTPEVYDVSLLNFSCNIILDQDFCFILEYLIGEVGLQSKYPKGTYMYSFLKFILNKISQE